MINLTQESQMEKVGHENGICRKNDIKLHGKLNFDSIIAKMRKYKKKSII